VTETRTASRAIFEEVTSWPGVEADTEERGELAFNVGERQIGHLHGDAAAHFSFPRTVWSDLMEQGRIVPHPVFPDARQAVTAAVDAQRSIAGHDWPQGASVAVRMGIHAGEAHAHEDGYVGIDINRAARIGALAHGGQVLVSETARLLAADTLDDAVRLRDLGEHELEGLDRPERVHEVVAPGLHRGHPPLARSPLPGRPPERGSPGRPRLLGR
jgi:class 3 adenylate cyclase